MKIIKKEQLEAVLGVLYDTNVPAKTFEAVRKMLSELPDQPEPVVPEVLPENSETTHD